MSCSKIKDKNVFIECIKLCINYDNFRFNENIFKQKQGVQMGNRISVSIRDIVMNNLLEEIIKESGVHIEFLFKYVDLLLCVHKNDIHNLFYFLNRKRKFTKELEKYNKITFLDVQIIRINENKFKWAQKKKTISGRMINYYSSHPIKFKKNLVCNRTLMSLQRKTHNIF